jgi:hypothetical protein
MKKNSKKIITVILLLLFIANISLAEEKTETPQAATGKAQAQSKSSPTEKI